jgi:DNA-binding transcriptional MerR regulator
MTNGAEHQQPSRELTIEELAASVGMSVRNVRSHQSRGLIPGPEIRDRVARYGSEHVARLRLVQAMQGMGFNLAAIEAILDDPRGYGAVLTRLSERGDRPLRGMSAETLKSLRKDVEAKAADVVVRLVTEHGRQAGHPPDAEFVAEAARLLTTWFEEALINSLHE